MPISPESISSIGTSGPDIVGSIGRGYTLADTINREQLNKMTLQSQQEEQTDLAKLRTLGQKYDLSKPEDRHAFAAEATKISPKLGMDVLKTTQEADRRSSELSADQMRVYEAKHEAMTSALIPMYQQIDTLTKQGVPPQMIEAQLLPVFKQTLDTLQKQTLPNGEKLLNQQDIQQISTMLSGQPGALLQGINAAMASSRTAAQFFERQRKANLEERKVNVQEESAKTRAEQGAERLDIARGRAKTGDTQLTPEQTDLAAALTEAGVQLPPYFRGKQLSANLEGLLRRHPGMSPDQIAANVKEGKIEMAAETAGRRAVGSQVGKVEVGLNEVNEFAPLALAASQAVPRGTFVPFNRLSQVADTSISDPNLKKLKAYLTSLSNAYDVVAARGGTDVAKRQEAHRMLDSADSPETLAEAIRVMQTEAQAAIRAGEKALRRPAGVTPQGPTTPPPSAVSPTGNPPPGPPAAGGGGPTPPANLLKEGAVTHFKNGQNWTLRNGQPVQVQ